MRYVFNPFTSNFDALGDTTDIVYVSSLADLPFPVEGQITLPENRLYFFLKMVDLGGLQINFGFNVFRGISQELAGIENATVVIDDTCTISDFRFNNTAITINAPLGAFDWNRVNMYDSPNAINVVAADNIVWETFGFINSYNLRVTGTVASLIMSPNCIMRSVDEPTAVFFTIASTAVITRRIRIQDSVFATSFATQTSLLVEPGASIQLESLILKTVRFTGLGTSVSGINGDDDRTVFFEVVGNGVINSTAIANMYMKNNLLGTPILAIDGRYPVVGNTLFADIRQKFEHIPAENSLRYISNVSRIFKIIVTYTVFSGTNNTVGLYIGVARSGNGLVPDVDRITESEMYTTTNGSRPENSVAMALTTLNFGDRVYCIVQNKASTTDVRIEFLNMIIEKANG